ncbi:uncharacterized protein LOC119480002 [Sebastes umbrosus]|uniref:uncharacterized protein LOC119480002 n=1 Tax=Sebastes umbrosus TaxID=72105 RepID=UPI00189E58AD|nr:uncharacterized protein LOC119480002 [Sebastes umbrosus]
MGSFVEFPCSFPNNSQVISISGWSKKVKPTMKPQPLKEMLAYSLRMNYLERGNNDCTIKLRDLKKTDASIYYFVYNFRKVTGDSVTCDGVPGVRLNIFASPVRIRLEKLVGGPDVPVKDWTVMEGQRIMLTCVSTCAANLNSNPSYIWYKNRLQLNGSSANSPYMSLDPISDEDTGSYVCAMIGYKDLPSSAVNLKVQRRPRNSVVSEISDGGSKEDSVPTQTHGSDLEAQNSDQFFNKRKSRFTSFSVMLVASVSIGLVITMMVTLLVLKLKKKKKKKKKKRRRCVGSVPGPPNPDSDFYMALDINSMSADYDTLDTVIRSPATDHVYENIQQPGNSSLETP